MWFLPTVRKRILACEARPLAHFLPSPRPRNPPVPSLRTMGHPPSRGAQDHGTPTFTRRLGSGQWRTMGHPPNGPWERTMGNGPWDTHRERDHGTPTERTMGHPPRAGPWDTHRESGTMGHPPRDEAQGTLTGTRRPIGAKGHPLATKVATNASAERTAEGQLRGPIGTPTDAQFLLCPPAGGSGARCATMSMELGPPAVWCLGRHRDFSNSARGSTT